MNSIIWRFATYNVWGINVSAKQEDVVQWHLSLGNMVFVITETKLQSGVKSWIANKFDDVWIFTSGMEKSYTGAGMAIIMNNYLNNSRRIKKTIDYIFVSGNLASAVASHVIGSVSGFFDTNYKAVIVFISLDGLLDGHLNSLHKQANKDHWKFNIKDTDDTKWTKFRDCVASKLLLAKDELFDTETCSKIDDMWTILEKIIVELANKIFLRCWFSEFQCSRNRHSSRFFGLKILVAKIVKKFNSGNAVEVNSFIRTWLTLNKAKAHAFTNLVFLDNHPVSILKHLFLVHKSYRKSKMYKSRLAKKASIRKAIEKQMEKFCFDKNYLVVDDELIVEPTKVKSNVNKIMEGDNFSVLKGTSTQSPVFAIGSVIEDAFKKNREIWLVLQDMQKAYDFVASAFVDNTIWIGNCQALTQYALNIVNEFFNVNNIFINNNKMVAIPINQGIFLSTEEMFKPSVAKTHSDVCFFVSVVLRKAITDKQFSYLVSAVLQPIVSYWIQFNFVLLNVCHKCDVMIRKDLKLKACLPHDFPDVVLHHPLLYGLKTFEQIQSESKLATVISFSNALSILKHLFNHKFLDLQIMGWALMNLLQFSVRLRVSPVNNFLAGVVKVFLYNELSLANNLPNAFHSLSGFLMLLILEDTLYFSFVHSLKHFGVVFNDRLLDKKGQTSQFLHNSGTRSSNIANFGWLHGLSILNSLEFSVVQSSLHEIWSSLFDMFTDGSLRNFGSADVTSSTTV
ncbi:hypothetical protein G9A89_008144 [Geosiphon pyriformis]|nr:hypothetical protein G9A89_008144 [Geosiphon pyriformis]